MWTNVWSWRKSLLLGVALGLVSYGLVLSVGCGPGTGPPSGGLPWSDGPYTDAVRAVTAQCQTLTANQRVLGNNQGGCNPDTPSRNGSGRSAFRVTLGGSSSSSTIPDNVWSGGFRVRRPYASASQEGRINVTSSGFAWDPGTPSGPGVAGATCTLQGIIDTTDPDPEPEPGPFEDIEEAQEISVVSNYEGDIIVPSLPELPEDWAYEFELEAPEGSGAEPIIVDITSMTGKINVVSGTDPVDSALKTYNITDYWPLEEDTVFTYHDNYWGENVTMTVRPPIENDLPIRGPFTSYPFMITSDWYETEFGMPMVGWQWWATSDTGMAVDAAAGYHNVGDVTMVSYADPPIIFPNGLTLGECGSYEVNVYAIEAIITQAPDIGPLPTTITYQLVDAGTEAPLPDGSTTTDTLVVSWTLPYTLEEGGLGDAYENVVTLAKGVGPVLWDQWYWAPDSTEPFPWMQMQLVSKAELGAEGGFDVTIE